MSRVYKFRTSLGWVEILLDKMKLKPQKIRGKDLHTRKVSFCTQDFRWGKGQGFIEKLYDFNHLWMVLEPDDSLWLIVELRDPYYGNPEYLLEEA